LYADLRVLVEAAAARDVSTLGVLGRTLCAAAFAISLEAHRIDPPNFNSDVTVLHRRCERVSR